MRYNVAIGRLTIPVNIEGEMLPFYKLIKLSKKYFLVVQFYSVKQRVKMINYVCIKKIID